MDNLGEILSVEEYPNEIKLTLMALTEVGLASELVVVPDGDDALDYLYHRGAYEHAGRDPVGDATWSEAS